MVLNYHDAVLTADAGCVDVCYLEDRGEIRIVRKADKEILRVDTMETFNLSEFVRTVEKYKTICNGK